jgi:hypothetical protein
VRDAIDEAEHPLWNVGNIVSFIRPMTHITLNFFN